MGSIIWLRYVDLLASVTLIVDPKMDELLNPAGCLVSPVNSPCSWSSEFARVASCNSCARLHATALLRDEVENVPQPGYVGSRYWTKRVLLVGQNPAVPPERLAAEDRPYTAALRKIRDAPTPENFVQLHSILTNFIPRWPVHGSYFPLTECGLELDEIAYCNLVRCRTVQNRTPSAQVAIACTEVHFDRWTCFSHTWLYSLVNGRTTAACNMFSPAAYHSHS